MNDTSLARIRRIVQDHRQEILEQWLQRQIDVIDGGSETISADSLRHEASEFLDCFTRVIQEASFDSTEGTEWSEVREILASMSRARARRGFTPTETATFIFSLKQPFFDRLLRETGPEDSFDIVHEMWSLSSLLDKLGLYTTEIHQKNRDEVIQRQREEMLELSTPVIELWEGVLALPLIGTLDSERTQVVMESLLQKIVDTGAEIAIVDITGVPTVDTLVAQHLLKTVSAARLMGADCIISGIRPQIAQTIVHLGVELGDVTTKATLAAAFRAALERMNLSVQARNSVET